MMRKMVKKLTFGFLWLFGFLALGFGVLGLQSNQALAQWDQWWTFTPGEKGAGNVGVVWDARLTEGKFIDVVKGFINWVLGILALIALIILLWWWFQMLTAAGDEAKYKKGWVILKQAGIALWFIAASWLIVSLIFFVIGIATWGKGWTGA